MNFAKQTSVAFTGYRTSKMVNKTSDTNPLKDIAKKTFNAIKELYNQGYTNFYTGMSDGFDMLAALEVIRLKKKYTEVKLIAVVPFRGQEARYSSQDKQNYKMLLKDADQTIFMADHFVENSQYLRRNDYMLENASCLVCYYSGKPGGTMYTYNRASRLDMPIINICE